MSQPPFEIWAKEEIARLRAEADALERALTRYAAPQTSSAASVSADSSLKASAVVQRAPTGVPAPRRVSKYDPMIEVWRKAGDSGLTLDELYQAATETGVGANRNSLRSMIWNLKKSGRAAERPGGRYAWIDEKRESAATATNSLV